MTLLRQMAVRAGYALALLLAVVILNFTLIHIAPGDIADTIAGDMGGATEEVMAQIRADYGLDKPFPVQLGIYLGNVVR
ncbi:MAG: ABC transporter permease, partial [Rhodobiaceae bacterium]